MAQHDYSIANQGFPATRADINNVLSAIATNNSGTSAPSTQYAGQFWIDTTSSTWTLYIHDGADDIQFATIDTSANTVNFIDSELGDNSVTTAKIADGNVTSAKLSYPLTTFSSTGIDDNATSTAITIDASENVLINTTDTDPSANNASGIALKENNKISATRDGGISGDFNRQTSDGDIIYFRKDGTTVGSIGVSNGDNLYIGGDVAGHGGIGFGSTSWIPRSGGAFANDAVDIGNNGNRMKDIYATNGTINTSDQNEKQSIQSLTTAEMNVAKRLSSLIKTFKWNNAVEKKGDSARTHTGIIAQDIQQAFTDEGLDASNYALFISGTWWEKEIFVDAVAEEVDENGNIITEAKDAYTYMDTKEEATEGYTERTRLGVRYPELLSFIQAYNDQRFTTLEARITALENN
jgi:hypothetical protein